MYHLVLLITIAGLFIELAVLPVCFYVETLLWPGVLHVAAASLLWTSFYWRNRMKLRAGKECSIELFSLCLITFFPVFGLLGACLIYGIIYGFGARFKKGIFEDYEQHILEHTGTEFESYMNENSIRQFRDEIDFDPYVDILRGHHVGTKAKVINKLAMTSTPENIALLKAATKDESPDIRLYAASALLKVESEFNLKIQRAAKKAKWEGSSLAFSNFASAAKTAS